MRKASANLYGTDFFLYELTAAELMDEWGREPSAANRKTGARFRADIAAGFRIRKEFYGGFGSLAEARGVVMGGWHEGAERVSRLAEKIKDLVPEAKCVRRKIRWSDDGDEICKDRLTAGNLDQCWRGMRRESERGPQTVRIETNWGGTACRSKDELFWIGAVAAALTDILENAGYRVELFANNWSSVGMGDHYNWTRVLVKECESPMRLDTVAGVLCHYGIFRVFGLLAKEQGPVDVQEAHGRTEEISKSILAHVGDSESAVFIGQVWTEREAVEALRRAVEQFQ